MRTLLWLLCLVVDVCCLFVLWRVHRTLTNVIRALRAPGPPLVPRAETREPRDEAHRDRRVEDQAHDERDGI